MSFRIRIFLALCTVLSLCFAAPGAAHAYVLPPVSIKHGIDTSFDFGNVATSMGKSETFTLENNTGSPLDVSYEIVAGTGGAFGIQSGGTCAAGTANLAAYGSCTFSVQFAPAAVGLSTATIQASPPSPAATSTFSIQGTGHAFAFFDNVTDGLITSLGFAGPPEPVIGQMWTRAARLKNLGSQDASISSVTVTPGTGGTFSAVPSLVGFGSPACDLSSMPFTIPVGGSCLIGVQFVPGALGAANATLTVTDTAYGDTVSLALTGNAVSGAALSFRMLSYDFGGVVMGSPATHDFTLYNDGDLTATLSSPPFTLSLFTPGYSIVSNTCGSSLDSGASCTVRIQFTPYGTFESTTTLTASGTYNDGTEKSTLFGLSLTGHGLPATDLSFAANTTTDFGNVEVGTTSPALTFTLTNNGYGTASLGAFMFGPPPPEPPLADNPVLPAPPFAMLNSSTCPISGGSLSAHSSCTVDVTFTPAAAQSYAAALMAGSGIISSPSADAAASAGDMVLNVPGIGSSSAYITVMGTGVAATVNPVQLLVNRGLNNYPIGSKVPTGWKATSFGLLDGKTRTVKQEGTASVRITGLPGVPKVMRQRVVGSGQAGDTFALSYWVKGSKVPSKNGCSAVVKFFNHTNFVGSVTLPCGANGTFDWTQKTRNITAPAKYTYLSVRFVYSASSGTVWFDNISLAK